MENNIKSLSQQLISQWGSQTGVFNVQIDKIYSHHNPVMINYALLPLFKHCVISNNEVVALKELGEWLDDNKAIGITVRNGCEAFFALLRTIMIDFLPLIGFQGQKDKNDALVNCIINLVSVNNSPRAKYSYNRQLAFEFMNRSAVVRIDVLLSALDNDDLMQLVAFLSKYECQSFFTTMCSKMTEKCASDVKIDDQMMLNVMMLVYFYSKLSHLQWTFLKKYGVDEINSAINPMGWLADGDLISLKIDLAGFDFALKKFLVLTKNKAYLKPDYSLDVCVGFLHLLNFVDLADYLPIRNRFAERSVLSLEL